MILRFKILDVYKYRVENIGTEDVWFSFDSEKSVMNQDEVIGAHKLVLADRSEVFRAQFFGEMKEPRDTINIEDSSKEAF